MPKTRWTNNDQADLACEHHLRLDAWVTSAIPTRDGRHTIKHCAVWVYDRLEPNPLNSPDGEITSSARGLAIIARGEFNFDPLLTKAAKFIRQQREHGHRSAWEGSCGNGTDRWWREMIRATRNHNVNAIRDARTGEVRDRNRHTPLKTMRQKPKTVVTCNKPTH